MKLFRYTLGANETYAAAKDPKDAYENRAKVDHTFHFLPVVIEEVTIPGYEIILKPVEAEKAPEEVKKPPDFNIDEADADQLKQWLTNKGIKYHPKLGEAKLRELVKNHV